ncbi:hypothetical protein BJV74DRAFT_824886 [Russula compacta]|nr:hypothetical protein BJV74DRAFT_824886 [Russula compacta]
MSDTSSLYNDPDLPPNTAPRLGLPGTPDFFPSVLRFIRAAIPTLPLDPVIFQSIILSVIAGNKHVLLRTRDEDITTVQNLAAIIFTEILGYTTHKHKIAPPSEISPSSFISSIFSSPYQGAPTSRLDSSFKMRAKHSRSYPASESHRRKASEPNVSSSETSPTSPREHPDAPSRSPRRPPFHATAIRSESSGLVESESTRMQRALGNSWLPSALVLTGLEHSSAPCHRALLRTLLENRITFGEDSEGAKPSFGELPEDFILVYVCPFDPRERPSIHKSLLDKFSLSVTIALHPSTREAHAAYLASTFSGTQCSSQSFTPAQPPTPNPVLPRDFLPRLRSLCTPTHVNIHASLRLYIADLIAAARHHHELDGTLLGVRCVQDAEVLVHAHRVLGAGDAGSALIERAAALSTTSAAGSSLSLHHRSDADVNVQLHWAQTESLTTPSRRRPASEASEADWLHLDPQAKWDVSEVDVAKVVPRVVSHRLRVRDGPEDEIMASVVFMATIPRIPTGIEKKEGVWRRRTVKEILVKLMAQV